ncbi:MAG: nuclear transport factor 2 family protein [Phycisphaerales bacterium]|nr:nuclear transport factor 2 family protein [Phycisphaerales bacterium]
MSLTLAALPGCIIVSDNDIQESGSSSLATSPETRVAIEQTLDELHEAASLAQEDRYFKLFTENAIFLGTDATERWSKSQFRAYAHPIFSQGKGWTYTKKSRAVYMARDHRTAWFDETLDNAKLGECRGTGVLIKESGRWRIAQYNLTIPVPNAIAEDVVRQIRARPAPAALGG